MVMILILKKSCEMESDIRFFHWFPTLTCRYVFEVVGRTSIGSQKWKPEFQFILAESLNTVYCNVDTYVYTYYIYIYLDTYIYIEAYGICMYEYVYVYVYVYVYIYIYKVQYLWLQKVR